MPAFLVPLATGHHGSRRSYDAVDTRAVHRWLASDPVGAELTVTVDPPVEARETYHDTEDWRLHRAGLTLCFRESVAGEGDRVVRAVLDPLPRSGGPSSIGSAVEHLVDRADTAALPTRGPLADRLAALVSARPLAVRFELHAHTTTARVVRHGRAVALVHLTRITIPLGDDQHPAHLERVAVERVDGSDDDLEPLVGPMERTFGLRPTTVSRYSAALHALGVSPPGPPDLGSTDIDRSMVVGELVMVVLRRQFAKVLAHEPGTRLGEDPEELHDMRVAIRRMRAAFKLFGPYLPARALPLRDELRWLGGALGEVRDLDVQLAGVAAWGAQLRPSDREALEGLVGPLQEQRRSARRRMIRALDSKRYERLVERMTATLVRGPLRSEPTHRAPVLAVAPRLIEHCHDRVAKGGRRLKKSSPAAAFHRLRIKFKALRYALEFHREIYGKTSDDVIRTLVALQDLLGEHQDADVATAWLHDLVTRQGRRLSPETVFAAGKVCERYDRRARRLRRRFPAAYARLSGRSWKRLVRQMEQLQAPYLVPRAVPLRGASESSRDESPPAPRPVVVDWQR